MHHARIMSENGPALSDKGRRSRNAELSTAIDQVGASLPSDPFPDGAILLTPQQHDWKLDPSAELDDPLLGKSLGGMSSSDREDHEGSPLRDPVLRRVHLFFGRNVEFGALSIIIQPERLQGLEVAVDHMLPGKTVPTQVHQEPFLHVQLRELRRRATQNPSDPQGAKAPLKVHHMIEPLLPEAGKDRTMLFLVPGMEHVHVGIVAEDPRKSFLQEKMNFDLFFGIFLQNPYDRGCEDNITDRTEPYDQDLFHGTLMIS